MTITTHDGFAIFPKRCNKCNRIFWLEPYDVYYKEVGIEHYSLKQIKCSKHCGANMRVKKYLMPNGKTVIFEYDENGVGKITIEAMDIMMEFLGAKKEEQE